MDHGGAYYRMQATTPKNTAASTKEAVQQPVIFGAEKSKIPDITVEYIDGKDNGAEVQNCKVSYPNGRVYEGDWNVKQNKPDGQGTMLFYFNASVNPHAEPRASANSDKILLKKYSGAFSPTHIDGSFESYEGNRVERKYTGRFLTNGIKHGEGKYEVFKDDGSVDWSFDGRWNNDRPISGTASNMPIGAGNRFSGELTNGLK